MLTDADKRKLLESIQREDWFREELLFPLLSKMDLNPILTHGIMEKGKDLVCSELEKFDAKEWIAIVAKIGNITGTTSGPQGYETILNQIHECFRLPYSDETQREPVNMNKVFVITNARILSSAKDKIGGRLKEASAEYANTHFIQGNRLASMIDQYAPDLWDILQLGGEHKEELTSSGALVLYVLSARFQRAKAKKRKKGKIGMTMDTICSLTKLKRKEVNEALDYMCRESFARKSSRGAHGDVYRLHEEQTILKDVARIELLFAIERMAGSDYMLDKHKILKTLTQNPYTFKKDFIESSIKKFIKGDYLKVDESTSQERYQLYLDTLEEERLYLQNWITYRGSMPANVRINRR